MKLKEYEFQVTTTVTEAHFIDAENFEKAQEIFLSGADRHTEIIEEHIENWWRVEYDNESD